MTLVNKIFNLVGAAIGIIELALPIIKEALVTVERIVGLIFVWTNEDEKIIEKTNQIYNTVVEYFEKFKNFWLMIGRK